METAPAEAVTTTMAHLVALDIDGTLVGRDGKVASETVQALELVRASGHQVVLATGRSLVGLTSIASRLGLNQGWGVCSNGALTIRLGSTAASGHDVVEAHTFAPGPLIRRASTLVPGVNIAVEEIGWGWHVNREFPPGLLNGLQKLAPLDQLGTGRVSRVVLHADRISSHTEALRSTGATVTPAGNDWLDVTALLTSKAIALENVRQRLDIRSERTVAVGDGLNDLDMLGWAARAVAMGHAPDVVRDAADELTGAMADNGVLQVLYSLVKPQARRPSLSPLAAQLTAAIHVAMATGPGPMVARVWHGSGPALAGCEVHALRAGRWVRQAPVPAAQTATMRDIEHAAQEAGIVYPRGDQGRRRAHWRTTARVSESPSPPCFELPLNLA